MVKRLTFLTVIIVSGLVVVAGLGFHALGKWQEGLNGERIGEFAETAELIGKDVKQQLDAFLDLENERPYTDYLYYHVSGTQASAQQQYLNIRSPLAGKIEHGLAYGHFQIEPDGTILLPNDNIVQLDGISERNTKIEIQNGFVRENVREQVLPYIHPGQPSVSETLEESFKSVLQLVKGTESPKAPPKTKSQSKRSSKSLPAFEIDSFKQKEQRANYIQQERAVFNANIASNTAQIQQNFDNEMIQQQAIPQAQVMQEPEMQVEEPAYEQILSQSVDPIQDASPGQARMETFVPILVPVGLGKSSIFGAHIFLIRHVQVEQRHLLQGFQLQEERLLEMVHESAKRFIGEGMNYTLSALEQEGGGYERLLDFGFGEIVLGLLDRNPARIGQRVQNLKTWYASMLGVVGVAVGLGLFSLWRGAQQQVVLARKKDDFISAVSHELRTPLTSIRMYAEMLEQGWVPSNDKQQGYYGRIRQESERLSRLIENVLDFSRIQRGRKRYAFDMGDLNDCVQRVVDMMMPYAQERGFAIRTDLQEGLQGRFDRDAVTQIVVNLVDNAIKYARQAEDKTIRLRTFSDSHYLFIEVEDQGPGVPLGQRKKIFEQFYRTEDESTRETQGTGLGLALVQRFAQAHQGHVRLRSADPSGAIFTVALGQVG